MTAGEFAHRAIRKVRPRLRRLELSQTDPERLLRRKQSPASRARFGVAPQTDVVFRRLPLVERFVK
jgi:hypothetical protein